MCRRQNDAWCAPHRHMILPACWLCAGKVTKLEEKEEELKEEQESLKEQLAKLEKVCGEVHKAA